MRRSISECALLLVTYLEPLVVPRAVGQVRKSVAVAAPKIVRLPIIAARVIAIIITSRTGVPMSVIARMIAKLPDGSVGIHAVIVAMIVLRMVLASRGVVAVDLTEVVGALRT